MCVSYNLRKSAYQNQSSQIAVTYSVIPRGTFVPLNWYEQPNIESNFFRTKFVKRPKTRMRCAFQANLNSKNYGEVLQFHSSIYK